MATKRSRVVFEADLRAAPSSYVVYGTPLPPLDPDIRDDGSYVPIWKQEVRDDKGRKRLHGAFTGGFSAGYFNTVGSKEGWTPSTFVSSRQDRAKDGEGANRVQRPEDFMDEEDLRESEESKKLGTATDFAGFGATETDSIRRAGMMDILKLGGETIGIKLLKRMGWKEGQGIGPKVRRKAYLGDGDDNSSETYLFAPENPPMVSFVVKNDSVGLGFEGEAPLRTKKGDLDQDDKSESFEVPKLTMNRRLSQQQKKKELKRGGFGVGILNDTGSDDDDPYEMGPQISYNRVIGPDKKKRKDKDSKCARPVTGLPNPLLGAKPVFISKKSGAMAREKPGFRKCHDGHLPLEGYVLGQDISNLAMSSQEKLFAPPEIPKDWKPTKSSASRQATSGYMSTADVAKASTLDPKSRGTILGETQLPGKSIFDYMTPEARERIVRITGRTDLPPALGEQAPKGFETSDAQKRKNLWDLVPKLDKNVAVQALARGADGWMPYAEDESKRSRYRAFLEIRAGLRRTIPERAPGVATEEWATELNEFARAAEVFKPITGIMASRFTSSTSQPNIARDFPDSSDSSIPLLKKPPAKPEDPAEEAAKMGMYGPMTRISLSSFYPSRLLCKRFNVRPPAHVQVDPGDFPGDNSASSQTQTTTGSKMTLVSKDMLNRLLIDSGGNSRFVSTSEDDPSASRSSVFKKIVVDPDRNEALEAARPGLDVFKAVFGSDNEDEDEED